MPLLQYKPFYTYSSNQKPCGHSDSTYYYTSYKNDNYTRCVRWVWWRDTSPYWSNDNWGFCSSISSWKNPCTRDSMPNIIFNNSLQLLVTFTERQLWFCQFVAWSSCWACWVFIYLNHKYFHILSLKDRQFISVFKSPICLCHPWPLAKYSSSL